MAKGKENRAVLVLPDMGVSEERIKGMQDRFQNSIVGTLKEAGALREGIIIVVVVVVVVAA